jgi:hypothetical protein
MTYQEKVALQGNLPPSHPDYQKIEAAYQDGQRKAGNQITDGVQSFMKNVPRAVDNGNRVLDLIGSNQGVIGFMNRFKTFDEANKYLSPDQQAVTSQFEAFNATLKDASHKLNSSEPTTNQLISTKDSPEQIRAKIQSGLRTFLEAYKDYEAPYTALTTQADQPAASGIPAGRAVQPIISGAGSGIDPGMKQENFPQLPPLQ